MTLSDGTMTAVVRRHLRDGRMREAEMVMEDWGTRQPANASLQVLRGWLCLTAGRTEDARRLVENAVEASPNLAFAYVVMGALHAAEGRGEEAEMCWQRALVLDPADSDASALLVQSRRQANDVVGAEQLARKAILAAPSEAWPHFLLAETLLARPDGVDEALRLVARGVALGPDEWRGWLVYGRALAQAGRWPEARTRFERALLVRPDEPEVLAALAMVCLQESAWPEAERLAKKMVVLAPKQVRGYRLLASAQAAQQRVDEAVGVLLHALRGMPDDLGVLMDLAGLHRRAGRLEEAATVVQQAQTLFPAELAPAYFVAELNLYQGRTRDAFEVLGRIERAKPFPAHLSRLPANASALELEGRAVVLTGEALSQVLLLARYAPHLAAMGAEVYVSCAQPMQWGRLAECLTGVTAFVEKLSDAPEGALIEPVICLPARFDITDDEPLWMGAYLGVEAHHIEQVHAALADKPRPWVGIELSDMSDATVLPAIARAIRAAGGTAVVLGPGIDSETIGEPTVWPKIPDLYVLAVWVKALDTVVAGDGVIVSVAGPLGKSAHILLGTDCDALWGMDADRTQWYPHMRLYRASAEAGWSHALAALHDELMLAGDSPGAVGQGQVERLVDHVD